MIAHYNQKHRDARIQVTHDGKVLMKEVNALLLAKKTQDVSEAKIKLKNNITSHERSIEQFNKEVNVFYKKNETENPFSGPLEVCKEIKRKHDEL